MLLIDKSKQNILETALDRLEKNTNINGIYPGDVAERFLNIFAEILGDEEEGFYPMLKKAHLNALLPTAEGEFLDMIGYLLACKREDGESDESYRYRISKQVTVVANANETAVRLACLSVQGVKDVILMPYTHGTGSFSVYVITDNPYGEDDIIEQVRANVNKIKAYGVRVEVLKPKIIPIQMKVKIIYKKGVSEGEKPSIASQVESKIRDYVNSRYPGEELIIYEIVQKAMEIDERIYDLEFIELRVKKKLSLIVNQKSKWNERFFEDQVPKAIQVV
ncbi:MAG: baseplate J/gp47 family protein [Ignavibacterium sp.]|nr:baseplate J/gp47 family protein [Ignavibacterium sp.]